MLLLNLHWLLILLVLHLLLELLSLHVLEVLEVRVEDHPLGGLERERVANWRVSLDTCLFEWHVEGLGRSLLEVELISKGFLLGMVVITSTKRVVTELFLEGLVHLVEKLLVSSVFVVPFVLLISGVIRVLEQDTSINIDVESQMLNLIVDNEFSVTERELAKVVWGLWVERVQSFDHLFVFLLGGQLLLIDAAHICLVHNEIIFVLNVIRDFLLDDLVLFSLFLYR